MMKSFIIAATSIACMLSSASITDANNQSIPSRPDYNSVERYRLSLISKYPKPENISISNSNDISKKDVQEIYEAIQSSTFKDVHTRNLDNQRIPSNGKSDGEASFDEITRLSLISVHSAKLGEPISSAQVEMTLIRRFYNYSRIVDGWSKPNDKGENVPIKQHVVFKRNGQDKIFNAGISLTKINGKWKVR